MSASGSATPTNTNRPPSSSSSLPTISRPHESSPTSQSLPAGEREEKYTDLRPTPTHSPIPQPSSAGRRLTESPPAARMAKRLRKESPQTMPDSRSSPSSDSQGGMADTEDLPTQSQHSEKSPPPTTAPKKKRTRTLTTPAQSAVLHALLAKSRFPTTAVREEVGREIGLSARKVQIWFQNQRQKARRPRNPDVSSPATQGPAQYGTFPSTSEQHTSFVQRGFPIESHAMGQTSSPVDDVRFRAPGYASEGSVYTSGSSEPPSRLLGPGMPGYETRSAPLTLSRRVSPPESPIAGPSRQPYEIPYSDPYPSRHSDSPPRRFPGTRPTSSPSFSDLIDRGSRTLPPLVFPSRMSLVPPAQRSAPASMPPLIFPRSPSPEQPFTYRAPQPSSTGLPPPFTLQPPPQWDNSHFTTLPSSAHSSSWSRPSSQSAHEGSASPTSPQRVTHTNYEELDQDDTAPSSSRGGRRFDPIRPSSHHSAAGPSSRTDREQRPSS